MIIPAYVSKGTPILTGSASNAIDHVCLAMDLDQHSATRAIRKRDIVGLEISVFNKLNAALGSIYQTSDALTAVKDALSAKGLQKMTARIAILAMYLSQIKASIASLVRNWHLVLHTIMRPNSAEVSH